MANLQKERKFRQVRSVPHKFDTRSDEETGKLYVSGYFAVFNSVYELWEGATESIAPGAFDGTLNSDIRCLVDHDTRLVLGRTKSKTLMLRIDDIGLWGEVEINPNDQDALNLYERVKRGDVDQCSFGFDIVAEEYEDKGDSVHWTIKSVKLYEVSVVTFPAYEDTSVSARKKDFESIKKRKFEEWRTRVMKRVKGESE